MIRELERRSRAWNNPQTRDINSLRLRTTAIMRIPYWLTWPSLIMESGINWNAFFWHRDLGLYSLILCPLYLLCFNSRLSIMRIILREEPSKLAGTDRSESQSVWMANGRTNPDKPMLMMRILLLVFLVQLLMMRSSSFYSTNSSSPSSLPVMFWPGISTSRGKCVCMSGGMQEVWQFLVICGW